jgi:hypothetical protein
MSLRLEPTRIAAADAEGLLVYSDDGLVAVLARLSDLHGEIAGQWYFEAGFGEFDRHKHMVFREIDAARRWIASQIERTK